VGITAVSDHYVAVKISDNTEIKMQRASVSQVVPKDTFDAA
jgi:preprotein translocase subunit YajC